MELSTLGIHTFSVVPLVSEMILQMFDETKLQIGSGKATRESCSKTHTKPLLNHECSHHARVSGHVIGKFVITSTE